MRNNFPAPSGINVPLSVATWQPCCPLRCAHASAVPWLPIFHLSDPAGCLSFPLLVSVVKADVQCTLPRDALITTLARVSR